MKHLLSIFALSTMLWGYSVTAQSDSGCEAAFDDVNDFTAEVYQNTLSDIQEGVIAWDSADWDNIVRRVVANSEFYLNNCADPDLPLAEQTEAAAQLAQMSLIQPPVESVDIGGDFADMQIVTNFTPVTQWIDLNGDGVEELVLHTQVPYFSEATAYSIRGGLSIAFFDTEDGWQGQVIAPVTSFVTDETGPHLSYAMINDNMLNVEAADQALGYLPAPEVQVMDIDGVPLTFITLNSTTGAGEAKELNVMAWDDRFPVVELRVAFDDWCYPGSTLDWEIREDGSVFVPSNGGEEGSGLHCGRTPEILFQWEDSNYTTVTVE